MSTTIIERPGFTMRVRGGGGSPIYAEYECPVHGRVTLLVTRDENGDPPTRAMCDLRPEVDAQDGFIALPCGRWSEWVISAPLARVRNFEVSRGKSDVQQKKTWVNTRDMGDGQTLEEFRAERAKIWDEKRRQDLKALIDDGPNPNF